MVLYYTYSFTHFFHSVYKTVVYCFYNKVPIMYQDPCLQFLYITYLVLIINPVDMYNYPILQKGKIKLRDIKSLFYGHKASK